MPDSPSMKTVCVKAIERKLVKHLDEQGMGCPCEAGLTVHDILNRVISSQGFEIEGEWRASLLQACDKIQSMLIAAAAKESPVRPAAVDVSSYCEIIRLKDQELLLKDAALSESHVVKLTTSRV